jgi:dienelactone hydrolase
MTSMPAGYSSFAFERDGASKTVFTRGTGPGVLIMHELPGLVTQCVRLADYIAARGFTVFLPLLFGDPNIPFSRARAVMNAAKLCISREIALFAENADSPVTTWLRGLAVEIRRHCPDGRGVGVIGLCLTGGFAINLMVEDVVLAPVASEPALPLTWLGASKGALGVAPETLRAAVERAATGVPLRCLRFKGDGMSPPEKLERLQREFRSSLQADEIPGSHHSVLTIDLVEDPAHPTFQARDRVVDFLRTRLF